MNKRKLTISLAVVLSMVWTMLLGFTAPVDAASSSKYELPTSATMYAIKQDENGNNIPGEWELLAVEKFKYNKKGYITKVTSAKDASSSPTSATTYKWKFKKGKPAKCTVKWSDGSSTALYKNGRLYKITTKWKDSSGTRKNTETFKNNKQGWLSSCYTPEFDAKAKFKFKYHSNGMPKKVTYTAGKTNYSSAKKFVSYHNKRGLRTKEVLKYGSVSFGTSKGVVDLKGGSNTNVYSYTYDSKGRVSSVTYKMVVDGKKSAFRRIVYGYGKKKTSNKRTYFAVMNREAYISGASRDIMP